MQNGTVGAWAGDSDFDALTPACQELVAALGAALLSDPMYPKPKASNGKPDATLLQWQITTWLDALIANNPKLSERSYLLQLVGGVPTSSLTDPNAMQQAALHARYLFESWMSSQPADGPLASPQAPAPIVVHRPATAPSAPSSTLPVVSFGPTAQQPSSPSLGQVPIKLPPSAPSPPVNPWQPPSAGPSYGQTGAVAEAESSWVGPTVAIAVIAAAALAGWWLLLRHPQEPGLQTSDTGE